MKISIGSDKSGYSLRKVLETHLESLGHSLTVYGPDAPDVAMPFYEIAPKVAKDIQSGQAERGILICGTGMGMSQVANSYKGVRAAVVESTYGAKMSRVINGSNILCMGGWMIAPELGIAMTDEFLNNQFTVGVEDWRVTWLQNAAAEFKKLEDEIYK